MRYMLLIYSAPDAGPEPGSPEHAAEMGEWFAYTEQLREAGVLLSGEPLHGADTAVTVRGEPGNATRTDGPFAETKEVLGGFYMLETESLDEAVAWAEKLPSTAYGSTEVRPILEIPSTS